MISKAQAQLAIGLICGVVMAGTVPAADWPQFRGPEGNAIAPADARPPLKFSPKQNVLWSVTTEPGNSSPVIQGDRLFLTAHPGANRLATVALDRRSGRELWRKELAPEKVEEVHRSLGSPASATPVVEGDRLYVHFGSFGLLCYSTEGQELWRLPMSLTQTEYGSSSSPILAGDNVILLLDQDGGSHLVAVNKTSGKVAWRVERPEMRRGFGTPLLWNHDKATDLVVPGTYWMKGLDPATGEERWRVSGLARITCTSPCVGDGQLFAASWTTGGDHNADHITMPAFDGFAAEHDANKDGKFSFAELPDGPVKQRFKHLDGNRDAFVDREEWESMANIFSRVENQAFAVKPGPDGKVSDAAVSWRFKKGLPYVASPVFYQGRFYMVKNGGMFTCLDPATGKAVYQEERLDALGDYYASLVAANGRIYVTSQRGMMSVVRAGDAFEVLAHNDLGEVTQATPAVVGDVMYVRTASHLHAFSENAAR